MSDFVQRHVMLALSYIASACIIIASAGTMYLWWYDPVVPDLDYRGGSIELITAPAQKIPIAFEARRVVCMSASDTVTGRLYAELVEKRKVADGPEFTSDGYPITPEERRFSLGSTVIDLHVGCWERKRVWTLPAGLQPTEVYQYEPHFETCNAVGRCRTVKWPPLPLPPETIP